MKLRLVAEAYSWQMRHICYYHHYHTLQQGCTLRSKKTCDHIFDDKLNENCPFTKVLAHL